MSAKYLKRKHVKFDWTFLCTLYFISLSTYTEACMQSKQTLNSLFPFRAPASQPSEHTSNDDSVCKRCKLLLTLIHACISASWALSWTLPVRTLTTACMEVKASLGGCRTGGLCWAESLPSDLQQVGKPTANNLCFTLFA